MSDAATFSSYDIRGSKQIALLPFHNGLDVNLHHVGGDHHMARRKQPPPTKSPAYRKH